MEQRIEVFKFGGASVRDAAAIRNAGSILKQTAQRPLVVVISAMGKTTNHLEAIIHAHYHDRAALDDLTAQVHRYHEDTARELLQDEAGPLLTELHDLWVELGWILEEEPHPDYNYHYDQVIVFGELASTKIVSAWLEKENIRHQWIDARGVIRTDAAFREARVQWDEVQHAAEKQLWPALEQYGMIVTQGFIGSTANNESTTLGREGSDYTAAILANVLDAASVTVWKDVPGIMSGDPRRFEDVTLLSELSYREAIEMTYYGAKVIHPKTIKPLQNKNIPLYVRPFDHPEREGTRISADAPAFLPPVVVAEPDQVLLRIATKDYSFVAEDHLEEIFNHIARLRIKVNTLRNTALSFMMCVKQDHDKLRQLEAALSENYQISTIENLELITVRHADRAILDKLRQGREIVLEERFGATEQMVMTIDN